MSRSLYGTVGAVLLSCAALSTQSQTTTPPPATNASAIARQLGLIVYPAKQQTPEQQSADEQQCYDWAKTNTGIDPTAPPPAAAPPPEQKGGQRLKGAAKGAAAGAVVGDVANNDADEGAAVGAAAGAIAGGRQVRKEKKASAEPRQESGTSGADRTTTFKKAMGTCLQGRGYTTG